MGRGGVSLTCDVTHLSVSGVLQGLFQLRLQGDLLAEGDLPGCRGNKRLPWRNKMVVQTERERETQRQRQRQRERETDRQKDRQTELNSDRWIF